MIRKAKDLLFLRIILSAIVVAFLGGEGLSPNGLLSPISSLLTNYWYTLRLSTTRTAFPSETGSVPLGNNLT